MTESEHIISVNLVENEYLRFRRYSIKHNRYVQQQVRWLVEEFLRNEKYKSSR